MVDEIFDRAYQESRARLNADIDHGIGRLARAIGDSLRALHRIEWSAPWDARTGPSRSN
jgi:hypothetical protein